MKAKRFGSDENILNYVTLFYPHIGKGTFGTVYKGVLKVEITSPSGQIIDIGTVVIVKEQKIKDDTALYYLQKEIETLYYAMKDGCANIVQLYDVFSTKEMMYFIMEFIDGNSLQELFDSNKLIPTTEDELISDILNPLMKGLQCLHDHDIAHRDVKLENIMYDKQKNTYKWIDFGMSCRFTCTKGPVGNFATMAPEVLLYDFNPTIQNWIKADIWSFGCTVYKIIQRTGYYTQKMFQDLYNTKKTATMRAKIQTYKFKQSPIANEKYPLIATLLENCLQIKPEDRSLSFENKKEDEEEISKLLQKYTINPQSYMQLLYNKLEQALIKRKTSLTSTTKTKSPTQWIISSNHDSERYISYELNSGIVAALDTQTNRTILYNPETKDVTHINHSDLDNIKHTTCKDNECENADTLIPFLQLIMKKIKYKNPMRNINEEPIFVIKIMGTIDSSFYRFNNDNLQVTFLPEKDNIIIYNQGNDIAYINNDNNNLVTFNINDILAQTQNIREKMQFIVQILDKVVNKTSSQKRRFK